MAKHGQARFIEPMECLPVDKVPEGGFWTYKLKLDGYRLEAVKRADKVVLYSRRGTDLSQRFESVTRALASLRRETEAARAVAEIEAARYARLPWPVRAVGAVLDFILRRP